MAPTCPKCGQDLPEIPTCGDCGKVHHQVDRPDLPSCTAHLKRRNDAGGLEPCPAPPKGTAAVCRMHGADSLKGVDHPQFRHGGRSKFYQALPARLARLAERMANDPDLLSLRDHIELVDLRLFEVVEQLGSGESGSAWRAAAALTVEMEKAVENNDGAKLAAALKSLREVVAQGLGDSKVWAEFLETVEQRRRLSDSEAKRAKELKTAVPADQLAVIALRYVQSTREMTTDLVADLAASFGFDPEAAAPAIRRAMSSLSGQILDMGQQAAAAEERTARLLAAAPPLPPADVN
jgi:hypothetical protein